MLPVVSLLVTLLHFVYMYIYMLSWKFPTDFWFIVSRLISYLDFFVNLDVSSKFSIRFLDFNFNSFFIFLVSEDF